MVLTGSWSAAQAREALELALGGCAQLRAGMRDVLLAAAAAAGGGGGGKGGGREAMQE
jgi:hypothetical protein